MRELLLAKSVRLQRYVAPAAAKMLNGLARFGVANAWTTRTVFLLTGLCRMTIDTTIRHLNAGGKSKTTTPKVSSASRP
jgi:hypothetical protein